MKQRLSGLGKLLGSVFVNSPPIFLDLGSSNTRIAVGKTLVVDEPSCIVLHNSTQSVVAVGKKALRLVGKSPASLSTIFPLEFGKISHPLATRLFLESLLKHSSTRISLTQTIFGLGGKLGVPHDLTLVEKDYFKQLLASTNLSKVRLTSQAEAIFTNLIEKPSVSDNYIFLDVGGQTSQLSVFSGGEVLLSKRIKWGGILFTQEIQDVVRREQQCSIGWHSAEKVKLNLGIVATDASPSKSRKGAVRGKDVVTNLSKTIVLSSDLFYQPFYRLFLDLYEQIESIFSTLPSEVVTNALDQGLFLTGGGSLLEGLATTLSQQLECQVNQSATPNIDVIGGLMKQELS